LKALYKKKNTIPKLIDLGDDTFEEQKMDDYYLKLENVVHDENGKNKQPI
jgi:hypothetical protein